MNASKLLCAGALLVTSGCVTDPGDLGGVGESSTGAGDGASGSAGESGSSTSAGGPTASGSDGGESGSTGEPGEACEFDVGVGLARVMTERQFENAVADVFGVQLEVDFDTFSPGPFEGPTELEATGTAAVQSAATEAAGAFTVPDCDGAFAACGQTFIDAWAPVALRGHADLDALFDTYESTGDYDAGVRAVVEAMISDPAFVDLTPTGEVAGPLLQLDGVSIATRLSLLLWNSVPDAALLSAGDTLLDGEGIEAELPRMFDDPRYVRAQVELYAMLTEVDDLLEIQRDAQSEWSGTTATAMLEEQERFVGGIVSAEDGTLAELLTSTSTQVNAELAALYGDDLQTPAPLGDVWAAAELDASRRAGMLTQLAFITRHSYDVPADQYDAPFRRGNAVLEAFGCRELPPEPPGVVDLELGAITDRPSWEENIEFNPPCAGCHQMTDPVGHAFGNYDSIGRWQEPGNALDGTFLWLDFEFDDAVDMSMKLAADEAVHACMATQYFRFGMRRPMEDADACTLEAVADDFEQSGGNVRVLIEAIATTEAFRLARP